VTRRGRRASDARPVGVLAGVASPTITTTDDDAICRRADQERLRHTWAASTFFGYVER
jgi:hypothetical protein